MQISKINKRHEWDVKNSFLTLRGYTANKLHNIFLRTVSKLFPQSNFFYDRLSSFLSRSSCNNNIKYKVLQMNPLETRKNPNPRWDSNPCIYYGWSNHWASGDFMVRKGEMWVFESSCITQPQSQLATDSIAHNCIAQSHWNYELCCQSLFDSVAAWCSVSQIPTFLPCSP